MEQENTNVFLLESLLNPKADIDGDRGTMDIQQLNALFLFQLDFSTYPNDLLFNLREEVDFNDYLTFIRKRDRGRLIHPQGEQREGQEQLKEEEDNPEEKVKIKNDPKEKVKVKVEGNDDDNDNDD
jgi:hypothetical protein